MYLMKNLNKDKAPWLIGLSLLLLMTIIAFQRATAQATIASPGNLSGNGTMPYNDFLLGDSQQGFFQKYQLEKSLELILQENIGRYLDSRLFFVSVYFEPGQSRRIPIRQVPDQGPVQASAVPLPTSDVDPLALSRLPSLPQYRSRTNVVTSAPMAIGSTGGERNQTVLLNQLRRLEVHYLLDSMLDDKLESLIRRLTLQSLRMTEQDPVSIVFERQGLYSPNPLNQGGLSPQVSPDRSALPTGEIASMNQVHSASAEGFDGWQLLYLLLGTLLLILIGVLVWARVRRSPESARKPNGEGFLPESGSINTLMESIRDTITPSTEMTHSNAALAMEMEDFAGFLVRESVAIGRVFSFWLEEMEEPGLERVKALLFPLGKNAYEMILPYLSPRARDILLRFQASNYLPVSRQQRDDYLAELREMVAGKLAVDNLSFIGKLADHELFALLDTLDTAEAVRAFPYLQADQLKAYLAHVPQERSSQLLLAHHKQKFSDDSDGGDLGRLLSERLFEQRKSKKIASAEMQALTASFEAMDTDRQQAILDILIDKEEDLYNLLRKSVFHWSDLPFLDSEIIRSATQQLGTEELTKAYKVRGLDIQPIVDLRPDREQQRIYEMAEQMEGIHPSESERILKKILKSLQLKVMENESKKE